MNSQPKTLGEALNNFPAKAYLLTVSADGPHTAIVNVIREGESIKVHPSQTAGRNIALNPNVTFLWPPRELDDYSLVVNGIAQPVEDEGPVTFLITKSVLHRPGEPPEGAVGPCPSDCVVLAR